MIKISDKYYISADNKNYILQEQSTVKDETSKNFGKIVYKDLGYFGKVEEVIRYIIELQIRQYVAKDRINSLEQLLNKIKRIEKDINNQFNMSKKS